MNGEAQRDMNQAWREYLSEKEQAKAEGVGFGWNPRKAFEAGWKAATIRSSGWYSGNE